MDRAAARFGLRFLRFYRLTRHLANKGQDAMKFVVVANVDKGVNGPPQPIRIRFAMHGLLRD
jgi:hypothetical protein